jgi:hypothetical protein
LCQFAESDSRFSNQADLWAQGILDVKQMALMEYPPEEILKNLQAHIDHIEGISYVD